MRTVSDAEAPKLTSTVHARTCTCHNTASYGNTALGVKMLLSCTTRVLASLLLPNTMLASNLLPLVSTHNTYCTGQIGAQCMPVFGVGTQDLHLPWFRQSCDHLTVASVSSSSVTHPWWCSLLHFHCLEREGQFNFENGLGGGGFARAVLFIPLWPFILHS